MLEPKYICSRDVSLDKREIRALVAISPVMLLVRELLALPVDTLVTRPLYRARA